MDEKTSNRLSPVEQLVIMLICALILFTKATPLFQTPTLWAEDGKVFLSDVLNNGVSSIVKPYASYFHILTRVVAYINVSILPIEYVPAGFFWSSFLVTMLIAYIWLNSHCIPKMLRPLAAIILIFSPKMSEVYLTLTNIHWWLSTLLLPILISPKCKSISCTIAKSFLICLIGLSDPTICALVPFFLFRWYKYRTTAKQEHILLITVVIAASIQVLSIMANLGESPLQCTGQTPQSSIKSWIMALTVFPIAITFLPQGLCKAAFNNMSIAIITGVALLSFATWLIKEWVKLDTREIKVQVAICFMSGYSTYLISIYRFLHNVNDIMTVGASRYTFIPSLFFAIGTLLLLTSNKKKTFLAGAIAIISILTGGVENYKISNRHIGDWNASMNELKQSGSAKIAIAPDEDWSILLECKNDKIVTPRQ